MRPKLFAIIGEREGVRNVANSHGIGCYCVLCWVSQVDHPAPVSLEMGDPSDAGDHLNAQWAYENSEAALRIHRACLVGDCAAVTIATLVRRRPLPLRRWKD
ncbi:hypothetical protein [Nocardia gamkensis]|uniref:hypothetical protein n=1 Tax=Nocardia gamkensis TaxID=352869 RepID=UPI0037CA1E48